MALLRCGMRTCKMAPYAVHGMVLTACCPSWASPARFPARVATRPPPRACAHFHTTFTSPGPLHDLRALRKTWTCSLTDVPCLRIGHRRIFIWLNDAVFHSCFYLSIKVTYVWSLCCYCDMFHINIQHCTKVLIQYLQWLMAACANRRVNSDVCIILARFKVSISYSSAQPELSYTHFIFVSLSCI